jgi:hypothetical protein
MAAAALMMEEERISEMSVYFNKTTRSYNPESWHLHFKSSAEYRTDDTLSVASNAVMAKPR